MTTPPEPGQHPYLLYDGDGCPRPPSFVVVQWDNLQALGEALYEYTAAAISGRI